MMSFAPSVVGRFGVWLPSIVAANKTSKSLSLKFGDFSVYVVKVIFLSSFLNLCSFLSKFLNECFYLPPMLHFSTYSMFPVSSPALT